MPLPTYDVDRMSIEDVSWRIKTILKAAGVEAFITDAKISAIFPDGKRAFFTNLELDTRA